jgi:hypothetical protein
MAFDLRRTHLVTLPYLSSEPSPRADAQTRLYNVFLKSWQNHMCEGSYRVKSRLSRS